MDTCASIAWNLILGSQEQVRHGLETIYQQLGSAAEYKARQLLVFRGGTSRHAWDGDRV